MSTSGGSEGPKLPLTSSQDPGPDLTVGHPLPTKTPPPKASVYLCGSRFCSAQTYPDLVITAA